MEIKELIKIIKNQKEITEDKLGQIKNSINSNYHLAKLDFVVIENYEDSIETLDLINLHLNDLQDRIIKRNRG